ncbi:hypothetical protein K439DRAFT_598990 [Ramaria rubella]|nr:hypothetical protein K439DRAFT_598990 [Ramaria rubella]
MWEWEITSRLQASGEIGGNYRAITLELLSAVIVQSSKLGTSLLNMFWESLRGCHPKLKQNVDLFRPENIQPETIAGVLMQGLHPTEIDFFPVLGLATQAFTSLGVAFLNPERPKSTTTTPFSVEELDLMDGCFTRSSQC